MGFIVVSAPIYALLSRIACPLGLSIIISLFVYHCYSVKRNHTNKRSMTTSLFLSFVLIIDSIIGDLCFILVSYDNIKETDYIKCEAYVFIATLGYVMSKFFLYMVLSFRLDAAFGGSAYEYSKLFLWTWRGLLTFAVISVICLAFLTGDSTIDEHHRYMPCRAVLPFTFFGLVTVIDIAACIINVYLFARQLRRATAAFSINKRMASKSTSKSTSKSRSNSSNENENTNMENAYDIEMGQTNETSNNRKLDERFLFIARKHFILTIISVGSTFVVMVLTIIFSLPVVWINFDYVINILCVMLMFSWNKQYYATLCCVKRTYK